MKTPVFYAFVFGLSLSSCHTVKGPQELALSQPAVVHRTTGSKSQVSRNTAHSKIEVAEEKDEKRNISQKREEPKAEPLAPKGARFFGEIWVRPGTKLLSVPGGTLMLQSDDFQDSDPKALSYFSLKSMYRGVVPKKSNGDQKIYKIVWH